MQDEVLHEIAGCKIGRDIAILEQQRQPIGIGTGATTSGVTQSVNIDLAYDGPEPPFDQLDPEKAYSWVKSPRWRGRAMEVGPLARLMVLHATGNEEAMTLTGQMLSEARQPLTALNATMGRLLARGIESVMMQRRMLGWLATLEARIAGGDLATFSAERWEPRNWPSEARGVGTVEAPRGCLGHWVTISRGRIENYQAVVPTTWNASPRDSGNQGGAYEAALTGLKLLRPNQPLEVLRILHSFDPCMACAAHFAGGPLVESLRVKVC